MKLILLGMLAAAGMNFSASGTLAAGSVERGDYLVNTIMGCGNCHTPRGPEGFDATRPLAGEVVEDGPAFKAVAKNITPGGPVKCQRRSKNASAGRSKNASGGSLGTASWRH